ncbi:hypothetical protein HMI56_004094 [Coelomomyces lativittatus]|nr:hypothetical protein HMI56_004094 [Coelomomyces lativittatus]
MNPLYAYNAHIIDLILITSGTSDGLLATLVSTQGYLPRTADGIELEDGTSKGLLVVGSL